MAGNKICQKQNSISGSATVISSSHTPQDLTQEQKSRLASSRNNPQNPFLLYHVADRKLTSQHFRADLLVDTWYSGHKLRINKYSNGVSDTSLGLTVS
jgi:hypothetical protein